MLAEFSHIPAQLCLHPQPGLFWAWGRFAPEQKCWGAIIPLSHMQEEPAAQKNGLFSFASTEQWQRVCQANIWVLRALQL